MDIAAVARASDAELVGLLAFGEDEPGLARTAWEALYVRHVDYLWGIVLRAVRDDALTQDIVINTFENGRDWAARNGPAEKITRAFTGDSPDQTIGKVRRWLAVIATRELADHRRRVKTDAEAFDRYVEMEMRRSGRDAGPRIPRATALPLRAALDSLSLEQAEALSLSLPWYDADTQSFAFPTGEAARLAASLGISVDTLRQRRFRALQNIAAYLQHHQLTLREE